MRTISVNVVMGCERKSKKQRHRRKRINHFKKMANRKKVGIERKFRD